MIINRKQVKHLTIALAISSVSFGGMAAKTVNPYKSVEASLESNLKAGKVTVQFVSEKDPKVVEKLSLPTGTTITGFKCEPLPQFSQSEGLDSLVRLTALRDLRAELKKEGIKINQRQLHALKFVPVNKIATFAATQGLPKEYREFANLILQQKNGKQPYYDLYRAFIRAAQTSIWEKLPTSLKMRLLDEVSAQTNFNASADYKGQNLIWGSGTPLSKDFLRAMNQTVLCFADLQTPDEGRFTVLVPMKNGQVSAPQQLLDVGPSLAKLESKDKILVREQE